MKRLTLAIFLLGGLNVGAIAQNLEAVLDNYLKASGVSEPGSIQSMYVSMEMNSQGNTMPMEMYLQRPDKINITMAVMDQEMIINMNGDESWMINPMSGSSEPGPLPPGQEGTFDEAMKNMDGRFADYKNNLDDYEYLGTENIEGKEYSKVKAKVSMAGEEIETINYFDNSNHMLVRQTMSLMGQPAENSLENYQEVDGYNLPFVTTTKIDGSVVSKVTFLKVEINQEIDPAIFAKP